MFCTVMNVTRSMRLGTKIVRIARLPARNNLEATVPGAVTFLLETQLL